MAGARGMKRALTLGGLLAALGLSVGLAPAGKPNEREVKPGANADDKDALYDKEGNFRRDSKIWVLDFKFHDPQLLTVDVPGRGRKVCWYVWYQVINNTKDPHVFVPEFELVTHDKENKPFRDQVLPKVQEAIQKIEDPTNFYKVKNSVTIANEPIPPSKPEATPRAVTGVAIWDDIDPDSTHYSIFVNGLSNGWSVDDNGVVRRKTLQLNFKRPGDRYLQESKEIRFVAPASWIYRASDMKEPK